MLQQRCWPDGPAVEDQTTALAPIAGAAGYPLGPRKGIVGIVGPYSSCDVWVSAPASWSDVTFRLLGKEGNAWVELDVRTLADVEHAARSAAGVSGILFTVRGRVLNEFAVEAYHTGVNHAPASFLLTAWGRESALVGDRAAHAVASPFALPHQEWRTHGSLVAPGSLALVGAHPAGGRNYLTRISITSNDAVSQTYQLETVDPSGAVTVQDEWQSYPAAPLIEEWTYPERFPLGESLRLNVLGVSPGSVVRINATGYQE